MSPLRPELSAKLALYSIDAIADMIIWTDRDGRYVSVNQAAQRLLGYSAEEFLRLRVCDVDPLFTESIWYAHWEQLERLKSVTLETVNTSKDGVEIPIEVTANLVSVDGMLFNCSIVRDITERKRSEAERQVLTERIYQLSITDGLTGIANRRRFDEVFASEISRHARSGEPLSIALIDVDHFKSFNDHYGHLGGDDCLRAVAAGIAGLMRPSIDLAARIGGEEFACILPGATAEVLDSIAERIRSTIESLGIAHAASDYGRVTVCVGAVSCTSVIAQTAASLMAAADALLYQAKRQGRNRVFTAIR